MACVYVKVTRFGKVYPCRGFSRAGKHYHDYPMITPPRDPVEGDLNVDTGRPVQVRPAG